MPRSCSGAAATDRRGEGMTTPGLTEGDIGKWVTRERRGVWHLLQSVIDGGVRRLQHLSRETDPAAWPELVRAAAGSEHKIETINGTPVLLERGTDFLTSPLASQPDRAGVGSRIILAASTCTASCDLPLRARHSPR